jgi:hypothetical protein
MATKRILAVILATLGLACAPEEPTAMPQVYEIDWTVVVDLGLCDGWRWNDPDTIYVPAEDNGPDCTDPPAAQNGVLEGRIQCDSRPEQDLFVTSDFYFELHTGGDAWSALTVEEPSTTAFLCYLEYEGTVTEL